MLNALFRVSSPALAASNPVSTAVVFFVCTICPTELLGRSSDNLFCCPTETIIPATKPFTGFCNIPFTFRLSVNHPNALSSCEQLAEYFIRFPLTVTCEQLHISTVVMVVTDVFFTSQKELVHIRFTRLSRHRAPSSADAICLDDSPTAKIHTATCALTEACLSVSYRGNRLSFFLDPEMCRLCVRNWPVRIATPRAVHL